MKATFTEGQGRQEVAGVHKEESAGFVAMATGLSPGALTRDSFQLVPLTF